MIRVLMSDDSFIREVEEELRNERLQNFWKRYGGFVIAAAVAVVLITGGYRFYEWYTAKQAAEAGDAFLEAISLADEGKKNEALAALQKIQAQGSTTYRSMAQLRIAAEHMLNGEAAKAVEQYDAVAADTSANANFRSIARLRAALILVDTGSVTQVATRVGPLTGPNGAYRASGLEALGLAYFKAGDLANAAKQFSEISRDDGATQGLKQRAGIMLNLIASRGGPPVETSQGN